ncbi:hypothetical protein Efla_003069 [Eimeria flavescens]
MRDFYGEVEGRVLHCALSLVGEPIMYPRINELVGLMHRQHISTFLVTNAQHPEALRALQPVTQLYLSIDAATETDLKALDRPVHRDSWARFLRCIDILKTKKQRTVFRLTLVHGYNCLLGPAEAPEAATEAAAAAEPAAAAATSATASSAAAATAAASAVQSSSHSAGNSSRRKQRPGVTSTVEGYASLILRGEPDLVEIKGMTFCGGLDRASLSMQNVLTFAQEICAALPPGLYAVASEHEHSCCVLVAHTKYLRDGQWYTWIDYPKFFQLALSGSADFSGVDYSAPSPEWAVFGSAARGFDPNQKRVAAAASPGCKHASLASSSVSPLPAAERILNKGRRRKHAQLAEAQQQEAQQSSAA